MAKLSFEELKEAVASYVDPTKIGVTFSATANNIVGLVDKIGKIEIVDTTFFDKLPELDGTSLPAGKTIEEYYQDLIMPEDFNQDTDGSRALKFYSPTYRPVCYSYTLGKKVIKESIPNNNIERAVNNLEQFSYIVALETKRLADSKAAFKYQCKRQLIGDFCDKVAAAYSGATAYVDATTDVAEGTYYKQASKPTSICVKAKTHAVGDDYDSLIADGYLIPLDILETVAVPVDATTGEAFIKAVKTAVEKAQDLNEGYSLNGNSIGAEQGLVLYVKQGVMPSLEVDTMAGAFNLEKLALNVEAKVIKDFGKQTGKAYAILMDRRAVKLHIGYEAMRENFNGAGDFLNLFSHVELTGFISRNAFVKIFVEE